MGVVINLEPCLCASSVGHFTDDLVDPTEDELPPAPLFLDLGEYVVLVGPDLAEDVLFELFLGQDVSLGSPGSLAGGLLG